MASDFIDDMATHLESAFTLFTSISVDVLPEDLNAITIRRIPSAPLGRYMDSTKDWSIAFQVLVKHQEQWKAIQTMNNITIHLDQLGPGDVLSADDSYQFIKSEIYTMPILVEKDSRGSYIYSALFNATITKN
ncbi:hypothetical protein J7I93_08710 [Bacillus sp. ISL-47]|uniref:phage tail terminator protein n=1 Tax=Bacillus sp. ISL-47 TaxID=2819130 RepID=UPI001BE9795A|nr:minor capsid protein [Bacillus sp. ISL-47]MBT2688260.1 hypothetical protein [Bacillus sp. ISL-47]MBT2710053.1 hypothetical protein [Pseudomonas sp. ISL-84]